MTNQYYKELKGEVKNLSGWGRTNQVKSKVVKPSTLEELQNLVKNSPNHSMIARGLGRSYGDAAQLKDGIVVDLENFNNFKIDKEKSTITAAAGLSFENILRKIVPAGFFLPVSPGTRNVTVGGAIASDVHGKNHHVDGSFGNHVKRLLLIDSKGELRDLNSSVKSSEDDKKLFLNTIGGMGLTGIIIEATFDLIKISSSLITVDTFRYQNLKSLMDAMIKADDKYRYSVAWVDSLDKKGRGVLTCGNHASVEDLPRDKQDNPLLYDPKALASTPSFLLSGLLNKFTVRAFNEAWYRKAPKNRIGELQEISSFFHPLDGVKDWNKIYGPEGFIQYQFAVPNEAKDLVIIVLDELRKAGAPSFLTVLKRFGQKNAAPLSFPIPGWTLAADIPASIPGIFEVLDKLDKKVIACGGRLYLAKDSRQSMETFRNSYPIEICDFVNFHNQNSKFSSDLIRRLTNYN